MAERGNVKLPRSSMHLTPPAALRARIAIALATFAVTTSAVAACSTQSDPVVLTPNGVPPATTPATAAGSTTTDPNQLISQQDALLNAVHGTWKGDYASITFRANGTGELTIRDCGPPSDGSGPFGLKTSCPQSTTSGRIGLGNHTLNIGRDDGLGKNDQFAIYMDADGHLHIGSGIATDIADDRSALVVHDDTGTQILVGTSCQVSFKGGAPQSVPCHWAQRSGADVVTVTVPDPADYSKTADEVFVWDRSAHILASPSVYVSWLTRTSS